MGQGPSDWEKGVLAAAKWLRSFREQSIVPGIYDDMADRMLRELTPDTEGTEARVVKQIATYIRERAGDDNNVTSVLIRTVASDIEQGYWRQA
jgi:hypothetical protein